MYCEESNIYQIHFDSFEYDYQITLPEGKNYYCIGTVRLVFSLPKVDMAIIEKSSPFIIGKENIKNRWKLRREILDASEPQMIDTLFEGVRWGTWFRISYKVGDSWYYTEPVSVDDYISLDDKLLLYNQIPTMIQSCEEDKCEIFNDGNSIIISADNIADVNVFSVTGSLIFSSKASDRGLRVSKNSLDQGINLVQIIFNDKQQLIKKIIL